jgi:hypothetical protein
MLNSFEVEKEIKKFISKSTTEHRYSSFDYCYNYFLKTKDPKIDIEKSCLVLGFYLASWGMFRGSSFLLQKSAKCFEPVIEYISDLDKDIWKIDVDNYDEKNIKTIIAIFADLKKILIKSRNADLTLITKIMLGVFGFVPAYDQYFCNTFRAIFRDEECGFRKLNTNSLTFIKIFYETNKEVIDKIANETFTKDFRTGNETKINYPKCKIIDMYGFTLGFNRKQNKNEI